MDKIESLLELLGREAYVADPAIATSLLLSMELQKPLLIEGHAGVAFDEQRLLQFHREQERGGDGRIGDVRLASEQFEQALDLVHRAILKSIRRNAPSNWPAARLEIARREDYYPAPPRRGPP